MDPLYTCIVHSPADVIAKSRRRAALDFRLLLLQLTAEQQCNNS